MESQQWNMQVKEIVFRHLILEKEVIEVLAVGDEGRQTDVVFLAIGFHGIARTAVVH